MTKKVAGKGAEIAPQVPSSNGAKAGSAVSQPSRNSKARSACIATGSNSSTSPFSMPANGSWAVGNLSPKARCISASRRTDIPAFFGKWFENRLEAGFVEYIPLGPRRSCSLRPEDVLNFLFWSKNPKPFLPVLRQVREIGYPVLWHVSITGLGGTAVEPFVPPADEVVATVRELAGMLPPKAVVWRYDPIFVSDRYDIPHHTETFTRLAGDLAGHVDKVVVSFVRNSGRRIEPDLRRYQAETGDRYHDLSLTQKVDLAGQLNGIAKAAGVQLTLCGSQELQEATGYPTADCNSFAWACRVYPDLKSVKAPKIRPTRDGCKCDDRVDIGAYDTCIHGCRYSYGSISYEKALENFRKHDPFGPCIIPQASSPVTQVGCDTVLPTTCSEEGACEACRACR